MNKANDEISKLTNIIKNLNINLEKNYSKENSKNTNNKTNLQKVTDNSESNKIKKEDDDEYSFTMKIKIANGQMRNLKINIKSDPFKLVEEVKKNKSKKENPKIITEESLKKIINLPKIISK